MAEEQISHDKEDNKHEEEKSIAVVMFDETSAAVTEIVATVAEALVPRIGEDERGVKPADLVPLVCFSHSTWNIFLLDEHPLNTTSFPVWLHFHLI